MAAHKGKCFLKVRENGVKICVISQGFFNLKVEVSDGLKKITEGDRMLFDSRNQNNLIWRIFERVCVGQRLVRWDDKMKGGRNL